MLHLKAILVMHMAFLSLALQQHVLNGSLTWFAPIASHSGYGREALEYLLAMDKLRGRTFGAGVRFTIGVVHHGDEQEVDVVSEAVPKDKAAIKRLLRNGVDTPNPFFKIAVCHSEPGAWAVPEPLFATSTCPPRNADFSIGRTMFETDRLPVGWAERLNRMDRVWVPSLFHKGVFAAGGVVPARIEAIPESIDTTWWIAERHRDDFFINVVRRPKLQEQCQFKFLSVFKWEDRKGWDVLLSAFFEEFMRPNDERSSGICLVLKTSGYHSGIDDGDDDEYSDRVAAFLNGKYRQLFHAYRRERRQANIHVISSRILSRWIPSLYRSVNCLVQPSRGEGWGRPHIEAMAMGIPVIATNWSGNTAFMHNENSLLLSVERFTTIASGAFRGHRWAEPSIIHLRELMRRVVEGTRSGSLDLKQMVERGRRDIVEQFDSAVVASQMLEKLAQIAAEHQTTTEEL
jgi:glycosyltransferase involved in cell wall biosynthesis